MAELHKVPVPVSHGMPTYMKFIVCDACDEKEEEQRIQDREKKIRTMVPRIFRLARLEDFHPDAVAPALSWCKDPKGFLLICGPCGTGKTHLAASVLMEGRRQGKSVGIYYCGQMFTDLRASFDRDSEISEHDLIDQFTAKQPIIFDDIGVTPNRDYVSEIWYQIIDTRYKEQLPTIFTCNLMPKDMAQVLGERITSRACSGTILKMVGDDRRIN